MKTLKTICVILAFMSLAPNHAFANDDKYVSAMQKHIQAVYHAQSIDALQAAVNAFERIGAAEEKKWEPQYYAAFGYIMMANREQDIAKKDAYLDLSLKAIEKAKSLVPTEPEVITLEGFVYMIRVSADPASRGPQFAPVAMQTLEKAKAIAPNNPRTLICLANMQYGTAQFFGSSTDDACALATQAMTSFETFTSENPLAPKWGKQMIEGLVSKCN